MVGCSQWRAHCIPPYPTDAHFLSAEHIDGRDVWPIGARADGPAKGCLDVCAYYLVWGLLGQRCVSRKVFCKPGYPAFRQANANVDFICRKRCYHVARTRREWDQSCREKKVLLREVEGSGEVLYSMISGVFEREEER